MLPPGPNGIELPESVFVILRDLIQERTGVSFADDKRQILADKLSNRVRALGLDSYLDYFYLLRYDAASGQEWREVQDAIAVPETYFWREIDQVWALINRVLPELVRENQPLYIWSAACASGEEPLTIAMALDNAGWFEKADIRITASDASPLAIARAKIGRYSDRSCRNIPAAFREQYFDPDGRNWRIRPEIHRRVAWQLANLCDQDQIEPFLLASIVFCRNVFIYFSSTAIHETVTLFAQRLPRPSYLFLGVAESLVSHKTEFELREIDRAFVYKLG